MPLSFISEYISSCLTMHIFSTWLHVFCTFALLHFLFFSLVRIKFTWYFIHEYFIQLFSYRRKKVRFIFALSGINDIIVFKATFIHYASFATSVFILLPLSWYATHLIFVKLDKLYHLAWYSFYIINDRVVDYMTNIK